MVNKIKFSLIIVFFSIVSSGLGQNKNDNFPKVYEISGIEILQDRYEIMLIDVIDTFLLAKLHPNNEHYYELLDAKSKKHLCYIGNVGESENDFKTDIMFWGQFEKTNNQLYIWMEESNRKRLYRINVTKSISSKKTIIDKEIKYSPEISFSQVYYVNSKKIIGNSSNISIKTDRLLIYNPESNEIIKKVKPFPYVENENTDINFLMYRYNMLYNAVILLKPDETKIVSSMVMFNRIDLFDINGILIKSYIDKENSNNTLIRDYLDAKQQNVNKINVKQYYTAGKSTDSYIYLLYYNQILSNYAKKSIPVEIRIFNWELDPVCSIKVPDYLQYISIDEKNGIMYGVAYFDEKILKYDIKDILDEIK